MKKILSLLLVTLLASASLAGCGGGGASSPAADAPAAATPAADAPAAEGDAAGVDVNDDGTVNNPEDVVVNEGDLVLWSLFSGGDGGFMDQIIADYNATSPAQPVTSIMLVWADYYTKLATAVAAGQGPDVGISHISKLPELVDQGIVIPFDAEAEAVGVVWDDYNESILSSVTFDGEKYAIPLDTHAEIMYYNNDLLTEAGVTVTDGRVDLGTGVDGFRATLQTLKDALPAEVSPISLPGNGDDPYRLWWATYFQMGGPQILSEDGTQVTLDPAIATAAADFVKSLYDDGFILPGIEDHGQFFNGGSAALFFGGTWTTGMFESTEGFNFGAQPYPQIFEKPAAWADSHVMTIPHSEERDEAATQNAVSFISYVSSTGGLTWAKSGQIPSNNKVLESAEYLALPFRSDYRKTANDAVFPPLSENFYSIKDLLILNLDMVWSGQATSADAVASIISEMETAIA